LVAVRSVKEGNSSETLKLPNSKPTSTPKLPFFKKKSDELEKEYSEDVNKEDNDFLISPSKYTSAANNRRKSFLSLEPNRDVRQTKLVYSAPLPDFSYIKLNTFSVMAAYNFYEEIIDYEVKYNHRLRASQLLSKRIVVTLRDRLYQYSDNREERDIRDLSEGELKQLIQFSL
jgi:hypothetical protein